LPLGRCGPHSTSVKDSRVFDSVGRVALVLVTVAVYCAMAMIGVRHKSTTADEGAHIAAGFSYWSAGDYRLQPENGNWPQRWVSLPLVAGDYQLHPATMPGWGNSDVLRIADRFFYESGYDADTLLRRGRWMAVLTGAMLATLVFAWSRQLFGSAGGWISLALFVTSPTMLAHGPLATSDMMAALFFAASVWAMWTMLHGIRPLTIVASVLSVAGLLLSKFSGPIVLPIAVALIAIRLSSSQPTRVHWRHRTIELRGWRRLVAACAGLVAAHVVGVWTIIWMSYGFRYSAMGTGGGEFLVEWSRMLGDLGFLGDIVTWSREHRLLPEAYLYGFSQTAFYAQHRVAFFNGLTSDVGGWTGFFPYAATVKETIPALLLFVWAIAFLAWRRFRGTGNELVARAGSGLQSTAPLWVLIVVYWAFALRTNLNIGHRHLLPTIPAMYILMGSLGALVVPLNAIRISARAAIAPCALAGLLMWHAVESVRIAPHYLAYFNQIDGGPRQAYRHLVDSSLDWGQDLPGLARWLDANDLQREGHPPVYLSYFGNARPAYYGIDAVALPGFPRRSPQQVPRPLTGGVYAISATMYQGIYLDAPGPWTDDYQRQYEATLFNMHVFDSTAVLPADRDRLIRQTGEDFWRKNFAVFEQLRFARLVAYLRQRTPDDNVGYSILIFRLTDADVHEALRIDRRP
jgi:hypothetical protein